MKKYLPAAALLLTHAWLMVNAAGRLSPTWDEIVYPVAGVTLWRTRAPTIASGAPYLSQLLCALPLLPFQLALPQDSDPTEKEQLRLGYNFTFHNRLSARKIIFFSRLPAVFFSLMTAVLLFWWIRSLWGSVGALASLTCYVATPLLLSRGHLALLEMPAFFFALLALCLHEQGWRKNKPAFLYGCGLATGLALLCKMICAPLLAVFFILQMVSRSRVPYGQRLMNILKLSGTALVTVGILYLPWHDPLQAMKRVLSFSFAFQQLMPPYFWHGQNLANPPSILSWAALALKAPPFVWGLSLWGLYTWRRSKRRPEALAHLLLFVAVFLLWPLLYPRAISTIQFGMLYLALAGLAGGIAATLVKPGHFTRWVFPLVGVMALFDAWHVHPHYLAYFNAFAGGPDAGYRWLGDSDQDWGQSLPALADYLHAHKDPNVLLSYAGPADPRAYGIRFQDLLSPALFIRETRGDMIGSDPRPVWVALGTKVLQTEPHYVNWLRENVKPQAMVGSTFLIYDITHIPEAYRWLGMLYADTRRPLEARWAFERAQALNPGNPLDAQALRLLRGKP